MAPSAEQRALLGTFLKTHRGRISPAEAGLRGGSERRRTPGLRREEVAQLSGISTTWYTWLEQGREVSVSPSALARLADGLRLSPAERAYVFAMAHKQDPSGPQDPERDVPPSALLVALDAMSCPAYLLDSLWFVSGYNDAALHLFGAWIGSGHANLVRYVFLDPTARNLIADWDNRARRLVAEFRADTVHRADDAAFVTLVDGLQDASTRFSHWWQDYGVLDREGGRRVFHHPADGTVDFEQVTLTPAGHPEFKLVMLVDP